MEGILVPNSYVSDDYDFNYSNVANATMNPKSQVVNVSVKPNQPLKLLDLPQEQSRENHGVQFSANNRWQNFPQQRLMQLTPQSELPITSAAPKINNFSQVMRSDQYLPQVNIPAWTPYNNFRVPLEAVNSLKNNFGGFLRNIRGLFK